MILSTTRKKANFYIARVGTCAGKPMWTNYTSNNAFSVTSENKERDFQKVLHLHFSGKVKYWANGTCQPSIRKNDMAKLINDHSVSDSTLEKMVHVSNSIELLETQLNKLKQLRTALAQLK